MPITGTFAKALCLTFVVLVTFIFLERVRTVSNEAYAYGYVAIMPSKEQNVTSPSKLLESHRTKDTIPSSVHPLCAKFPYKWSNGLRNEMLGMLQAAVNMFDEIGTY